MIIIDLDLDLDLKKFKLLEEKNLIFQKLKYYEEVFEYNSKKQLLEKLKNLHLKKCKKQFKLLGKKINLLENLEKILNYLVKKLVFLLLEKNLDMDQVTSILIKLMKKEKY